MTFASTLGLIFLVLFGLAIAAGALRAKRLIAWENHALTSIADALRDYRLGLEEEQRLLEPAAVPAEAVVVPARPVRHEQRGNRAA